VVLKPSEHAPATAALIARRLREHFPAELVEVVQGDGEVAAQLLEQRFDHVFFTGGGRVGRLVMAAAARHLTPVTLELGGKSPAIVLPDADPVATARRLCWGKGINAGQTCIAPDHLLLVPGVRDVLVPQLAAAIQRFYGEEPLHSPDLARIVNAAQFERLEALLSGARQDGRVLLGGASDPQRRRIEPTVIRVEDPDRDPLMQEELFGPLLPLVEVDSLEEALERIRRGPSPLALYLFGGDAAARRRVLDSTSSGSVVFNDVILQAGIAPLRFGGVGESGMGAYHGETGFRTFSHLRPVVQRSLWPDPPFRYPPYAGKRRFLERLLG
jgi:aldehyde dehydrogenase (NAD+)